MSTEKRMHGDPEIGYPQNTFPHYAQRLPEMHTTQQTFHPPPPEYVQEFQGGQAANVANPPPYNRISSNPLVMPSPEATAPTEVALSFPRSVNNQEIWQNPPPMYKPGFVTHQPSESTAPQMVLPQPTALPPASAINYGMVPPSVYVQNSSVPGAVYVNSAPPMVMTTQTTVISTEIPHCRDYLPWSIFNLICCCLIFGIVALVFSLQTRSAKRYRDWEAARKKSRVALALNITALLVGIAFIIIIPSVYYTSGRSYTTYYYYNG